MSGQKGQERPRGEELQLVIFRLLGEEFGLDISQTREIIRMQDITVLPNLADFVEGIINLRGKIIAVIDLGKRFGMPAVPRTEKTRIIISEISGNTVGIIVDAVPEVVRIYKEDVEPAPVMLDTRAHAEFIKGVGKIKDRLIVLLDMDKVFNHEEIKQMNQAGIG